MDNKKKIIIVAVLLIIVVIFDVIMIIPKKEPIKKEEPKIEEQQPIEETPKEEPKEEEPVLDIDSVIKNYQLESIKTYINEDRDLFQEYASIVLSNGGITYKKQVLMMFKVVEMNKNQLDKYYFFEKLKTLKMVKGKEEYVAYYVYTDNTIEINDKATNATLLHELMHFVDHNLPGENDQGTVCNRSGVVTLDPDNCSEGYRMAMTYMRRLMVEAGAETNTFRYFGETSTGYLQIDSIYNLLAYMYGEQTINDIYYSPTTMVDLFKLFQELGITREEYELFLADVEHLAHKERFYGKISEIEAEQLVLGRIVDFLSRLYKLKYGQSWERDKEFSFIMQVIWNYTPQEFRSRDDLRNYLKDPQYLTEKEIEIMSDTTAVENMISQLNSKDLISELTYFYMNNKHYFFHMGKELTLIEYNIKEQKISSTKKLNNRTLKES